MPRTAGLPNLVNPNAHDKVSKMGNALRQAPQLREFWRPFFTSFMGRLRGNFKLSVNGMQAVGPVNSSSSFGGVTITPELALMLSAVWACVGRYQKTVSTLPLPLMRKTGRNSAEPFPEHPLYRVLHDQPNSQMSASAFWQAFTGQQMTWGAGYALKLRAPDRRIIGLKPLLSAYMTAYLDEQERLRYYYSPGGGPNTDQDYAADELFVVMDRTMDGYAPLSRIQYAANSLGVAIAADRSANLAFKNGLRASGILTIAQWLKEDQRQAYRDKVNEFVGTGTGDGNDKQFGVFVAENATKFEAINLKPQDLELLSSRKYSVEDVCRWYDTPPILVGHSTEGQTMWGTGVEQIILGWLKLGLAPVLRTNEQEIWRQLLTPAEQVDGIFAEYNLEALLRGDSAARAAFWSQMLQNGVYTRREARERESLPEIPDSDQLTVQSNLVPLEQLGQNPQQNDAQAVRNALRSFLGMEDDRAEPKAKGP
jgi:HK97 family phage portal protein